jgi:hypothetical protein
MTSMPRPAWRLRRSLPAAALLSLLAGGCTYTGPATGPGTLTISTHGTIPPAPPPAPGSPTPEREPPAPRDGAYAGVATPQNNPGGMCRTLTQKHDSLPSGNTFAMNQSSGAIAVRHFVVRGDRVTFGGFRGAIRPEGSLTMRAGEARVVGAFSGETFHGRLWRPQPSCTFALTLQPVE